MLLKLSLFKHSKQYYKEDKLYVIKQRRDRLVKNLKEFTDEEIEKYTVAEMLEMERHGIAKMPDELYEKVLFNT